MEKQELIDEINNFLCERIDKVHPYMNSSWEIAQMDAYQTVLEFIKTLNK